MLVIIYNYIDNGQCDRKATCYEIHKGIILYAVSPLFKVLYNNHGDNQGPNKKR